MIKEEALEKAIAILFYHKCHFCKSKEAVEELGEIMEVLEKMKAEEEKIECITFKKTYPDELFVEIPEEMNRVVMQDMLDGLMPGIADYMQIITFERPIDMMVEVAGQIKVVKGNRHDKDKGRKG